MAAANFRNVPKPATPPKRSWAMRLKAQAGQFATQAFSKAHFITVHW